MVKVFKGKKNEYYMDGYMQTNLDIAKTVIKKDWDMVFVYDGYEGTGKSVKAMQDAYYCDPTLNLERVVFNPREFRQAVLKAKPYQAVVYDEAYTGLSSRSTMTAINKALVGMLAEIRQKNLFVFVVMPSFFDLDRYVALWRSRALIHVYTGKNFMRGFFAFFNQDKKKFLYIQGKKYYSYTITRPNFSGRFTNHYVFNEGEYRKKKKTSLQNQEQSGRMDQITKDAEILMQQRLFQYYFEIPNKFGALLLGITPDAYRHRYKVEKEHNALGIGVLKASKPRIVSTTLDSVRADVLIPVIQDESSKKVRKAARKHAKDA